MDRLCRFLLSQLVLVLRMCLDCIVFKQIGSCCHATFTEVLSDRRIHDRPQSLWSLVDAAAMRVDAMRRTAAVQPRLWQAQPSVGCNKSSHVKVHAVIRPGQVCCHAHCKTVMHPPCGVCTQVTTLQRFKRPRSMAVVR